MKTKTTKANYKTTTTTKIENKTTKLYNNFFTFKCAFFPSSSFDVVMLNENSNKTNRIFNGISEVIFRKSIQSKMFFIVIRSYNMQNTLLNHHPGF